MMLPGSRMPRVVSGPGCERPEAWGTFGPDRPSVAEREGFEPSIQLETVWRFSKALPSATRPPLQQGRYARHRPEPQAADLRPLKIPGLQSTSLCVFAALSAPAAQ